MLEPSILIGLYREWASTIVAVSIDILNTIAITIILGMIVIVGVVVVVVFNLCGNRNSGNLDSNNCDKIANTKSKMISNNAHITSEFLPRGMTLLSCSRPYGFHGEKSP
jgi:hypothetical protein